MVIATHIIKIKGSLDTWNDEKKIQEYVEDKINNEIDTSFHTYLELLKITGNRIDIWVYIHAFPSEVTNDIIKKWIREHIKDEGISLDFEFEMIFDLTDKNCWKNTHIMRIP
jgi:hypothetical protein